MSGIALRYALLLTSSVFFATCAAAAPPVYSAVKTVPLGAPDHWDYVTFDAGRVFLAHGDHTDVVDGRTGAILGRLDGLKGAHGTAITGDGTIYADSGNTGQITAFDGKTFAAGKSLPAGADADGVIVEPKHNLIAVANGDAEALTLIDPAAHTVAATVKLGGGPESIVADGLGHIYVDMATTGEMVAVDAASAKVIARNPMPGCKSPHGLAIDTHTRRLFATCANDVMKVVDADSGRVLQSFPIGHGTDAAAFDPTRRLVYSSNNDGTLSVFHEDTAGVLTALGNVKTARGARTMAVDPASGRVYLATADVADTQPPAQNGVQPRLVFKPGSVKLLFLDPPVE